MTSDHRFEDGLLTSKTVTLPRLNRLSPSLEGTALKIMEESGELAQAIGKFRGLSGERQRLEEEEALHMVALELIDVAQTAVTNTDIAEIPKFRQSILLMEGFLLFRRFYGVGESIRKFLILTIG